MKEKMIGNNIFLLLKNKCILFYTTQTLLSEQKNFFFLLIKAVLNDYLTTDFIIQKTFIIDISRPIKK